MRKTWDMPLSKEIKTLKKNNLKSEDLIPTRLTSHTRNQKLSIPINDTYEKCHTMPLK